MTETVSLRSAGQLIKININECELLEKQEKRRTIVLKHFVRSRVDFAFYIAEIDTISTLDTYLIDYSTLH